MDLLLYHYQLILLCSKQEENGYHRQFVSCTPASLRDHVLHPKANHQPKQSTTTTNSLSLDSIAASQVRVTLSVYAILQHKTGNSLTLAQQTSRLKASCEGAASQHVYVLPQVCHSSVNNSLQLYTGPRCWQTWERSQVSRPAELRPDSEVLYTATQRRSATEDLESWQAGRFSNGRWIWPQQRPDEALAEVGRGWLQLAISLQLRCACRWRNALSRLAVPSVSGVRTPAECRSQVRGEGAGSQLNHCRASSSTHAQSLFPFRVLRHRKE